MNKLFIYNVNGTHIEDTEAFEEGWRKAVALATEEHTIITREVVNMTTGESREEFYTTSGFFLTMRFYDKKSAQIF